MSRKVVLPLDRQCELAGLPKPIAEYRFHPRRQWRLDFAFQQTDVHGARYVQLAVEIDGGGFVNGRHSRGKGIENDCEKYAEAMVLGWCVLRVTPKQVASGQALTWIQQLLKP